MKLYSSNEYYKLYQGSMLDMLEIIEPETIDSIVCDPPFNINYHYNTYKDKLDENEYYEMLESIFGEDKCVLIHYPEQLYKFSFQIGKIPEKVISWVYNSNTAKQHRDIGFFGIKPDMKKVRQPYKNLNDKRIIERIKNGNEGGRLYDWWNINQVKNVSKEKQKHPCQMPLEVMKKHCRYIT